MRMGGAGFNALAAELVGVGRDDELEVSTRSPTLAAAPLRAEALMEGVGTAPPPLPLATPTLDVDGCRRMGAGTGAGDSFTSAADEAGRSGDALP
jgi:hypothetical protein